MKPKVNAKVMSKSKGARIAETNPALKNKNWLPDTKNARAMPPRPISAPPIPTIPKPGTVSFVTKL